MQKRVLYIALVFSLMAACQKPKEEPVPQKVLAIATVNGTAIPFETFKKAYLAERLDLQNADGPVASARQLQKENILQNKIDELLLLDAAKKLQIKVKDEELEEYFKIVTSGFDAAALENEIAARGQTLASFKDTLRKNLTISHYLTQEVYARVDVSEEELLASYQAHPEKYTQMEAIKLRQILVPGEALAQEVHESLGKGTKFEDAAAKYSIASESYQGGDMGWIRRGNLPQNIEDVVFSLKTGTISPVVPSDYGYHIFLVEAHTPAKELKFDQVKAAIERDVRAQKEQEAQNTLMETLHSAASITINKQLLEQLD